MAIATRFQYHDHTADIIVHSWGSSLAEALAQVCVGMFNYMTPLEKVDIVGSVDVHATGHDMLDLLYHLLDEFLYMFSTEMHICRCIEILAFDEQKFSISARGYGEKMDLKKHEQGTEIKAITMHMMKILDPKSMLTEEGRHMRQEEDTAMSEFPYEVYVLLDIWEIHRVIFSVPLQDPGVPRFNPWEMLAVWKRAAVDLESCESCPLFKLGPELRCQVSMALANTYFLSSYVGESWNGIYPQMCWGTCWWTSDLWTQSSDKPIHINERISIHRSSETLSWVFDSK